MHIIPHLQAFRGPIRIHMSVSASGAPRWKHFRNRKCTWRDMGLLQIFRWLEQARILHMKIFRTYHRRLICFGRDHVTICIAWLTRWRFITLTSGHSWHSMYNHPFQSPSAWHSMYTNIFHSENHDSFTPVWFRFVSSLLLTEIYHFPTGRGQYVHIQTKIVLHGLWGLPLSLSMIDVNDNIQ